MAGKLIKKVCLLGDSSVGKTSLVRKYVYDTFDDSYIATIGTKTVKKELKIEYFGKEVELVLMIWDIIGQKEYRRVQSMSFSGTSAAMVVCDITRAETLESIRDYWVPELQKVAGKIPMVFMANKCDLVGKEGFDGSELGKLAAEHKSTYMLTSAKTGENVENAFLTLGKALVGGKGDVEVSIKTQEAKLSPAEVLDNIFSHFVEHYGQETDFAMAIIRKQCNDIGLDIKSPSKGSIVRLIDKLAEVERDTLSVGQIGKNKVERRNFLLRM
ncbi:MAG: GTP-binding protein [Thermoplasmata archaeon]|nr:GTP-binding protein [Thermoplasmata archaeon]